jgi:pimeloyl-ACP methyl ester carboxylesterase
MTVDDRARAAVLAPGGNYGPDGPLLMFAAAAAEQRGAGAYPVGYGPGDQKDLYPRVQAAVAAAVDELGPAVTPLLVGKSLGTAAAAVAAERGLPAVWFTPLLTEPEVVAALRRATAPCLLIGGTADDWWDGGVARSLSPHVLEVDGADHRMFLPGPLKDSACALGETATAVELFLDEVVWPAA